MEIEGNSGVLKDAQNEGMRLFRLSEQDVHIPNFGEHSLRTMDCLAMEASVQNY